MEDDEIRYNERMIQNLDEQDFEEANNEGGKNNSFYGNELAFEMQIRNPKSEENFVHLNRDVSGAFFDRWDKAVVHENLHFLDCLEALNNRGFELESLQRSAIKRVAEIGVVSQGVDGNLQKTRISRVLTRSSFMEEKKRSRFGLFNRGVQ